MSLRLLVAGCGLLESGPWDLAAGRIRDKQWWWHHNWLLRAGINPAPTTCRLIDLVGAGFTPAHNTSSQKPDARSQQQDALTMSSEVTRYGLRIARAADRHQKQRTAEYRILNVEV